MLATTKPEAAKKPDFAKCKKTEPSKEYIDNIKNSRTFEPLSSKPLVGAHFWRPRKAGETLRGRIIQRFENIRQSTSYAIEKEDGEIVEVFGNRVLHKLIKDADAMGKWVEIEYCGKQWTNFGGHWRRIFRLYVFETTEFFAR